MDEYQPRNSIGTSIVNGKSKIKINPQANSSETILNNPATFNIESGDIQSIVKSIANSSTSYRELAKVLLPYAQDVKIIVSSTIEGDGGITHSNYKGIYRLSTKTIAINPDTLNNQEDLADTILHELIHHFTVTKIHPYITDNGTELNLTGDNVPDYIVDLVRIYNNARKNVDLSKIEKMKKQYHDLKCV